MNHRNYTYSRLRNIDIQCVSYFNGTIFNYNFITFTYLNMFVISKSNFIIINVIETLYTLIMYHL